MKYLTALIVAATLGACSAPNFVTDAAPIQVTAQMPDHFELPARFGLVRQVYGRTQAAGAEEAALWEELAAEFDAMGMFAPLQTNVGAGRYMSDDDLVARAIEQRFDYLLILAMRPETGSADISIVHVGSGGVMATSQAVSPRGGERGFWGGQVNNPNRLERVTLRIARAALPEVREVLEGVQERQEQG